MKTPGNVNAMKREIVLFIVCLVLMSILYGTPRLFSEGALKAFFVETLLDCIIMTVCCLPVWWLHFRKWTGLPMKRRFMLHFLTGVSYFLLWIAFYQLYNIQMGLPLMTKRQMLQNSGPNILFYIQVFSLLHINLFFLEREKQQRRVRELRELAYKAEIDSLKAQIQPHFLFNTLNSISASVPAENEHTRVLIAQLADTFRYALRSTKEEGVPLWQELEFLKTYLLLEKARFGNRLEFDVVADGCNMQSQIPPMLLQPLVENAVKHAIEPALDGGNIMVLCRQHINKIHFSITNTGLPYQGTIADMFNGRGVGLTNIARRLENQFGENVVVQLEARSGVKVSFDVPIVAI